MTEKTVTIKVPDRWGHFMKGADGCLERDEERLVEEMQYYVDAVMALLEAGSRGIMRLEAPLICTALKKIIEVLEDDMDPLLLALEKALDKGTGYKATATEAADR